MRNVNLMYRPNNQKFYSANSERVDGVVYMGSGNRIGEALAGVDVPALLLWGTRDPFCPADVLYFYHIC